MTPFGSAQGLRSVIEACKIREKEIVDEVWMLEKNAAVNSAISTRYIVFLFFSAQRITRRPTLRILTLEFAHHVFLALLG